MPAAGSNQTTKTVAATGRLQVAKLVHAARQGDTTVLLDASGGYYYTLDGVASRIWELLALGTSAEAIVAQLHTEYDVPLITLKADITELLERLLALKLIERETPR